MQDRKLLSIITIELLIITLMLIILLLLLLCDSMFNDGKTINLILDLFMQSNIFK